MSSPIKTIPASPPGAAEIETAVLELLADVREQDPSQTRADHYAAGEGLALDSLEGVEIVVGLEERLGIRLPDSTETCEALRSVQTLVEFVRTVTASNRS